MSKLTIVAAVTGLFLISCQKKEQIQSTEDKLTSGTWKVSSFTEGSTDRTSDYTDIYLFGKDGRLTISGDHSASGRWYVSAPCNASLERMEVRLHLEENCRELSGNWYVSQESEDMIQLSEELENSNFYHLTLTKN